MITGVRLSELAIGSPILSASWEYKELTGKDAVIKRLEDQFYHASYLGFTYVIDTIRPNITSNGRLTLENNGINGDIWTFEERMAKYHEFASANHMTVMLEVEFTVQVTENNVDEYVRFILSSLVARYQWVKRWIIGVNPDKTYADGTYNCSPELYVYMMNELYRQIKLFDHEIQVGGPNIYESITPFLNGRTGWLAEASGEFYTKSSDYLDIGPHGFLTNIDFFAFQGRQDSSHYNYNNYGSIVSNIRTLIYDHLGDNVVTLFSTTQGHAANFSNTTALMNQPYYDLREILKATKNGVIAFKNELVDAYPDSQAWQGHFDSSRIDYGIMKWSMHSKYAYSTYKFIFDALDGYITLKNVTDIYEEDDNLESITFQKIIEGTVYNTTIIWCKSFNTATVSLLQASFNRAYQLLNGTKTNISDNVDINLLAGHFLIVYDEVEELELDKEDIRLNIERRLRYQREINDQMLAELPSSFNKEVTDTNVYRLLRSVAAELADTSMILTMIKEDLYLDTARENAIYENFGTLVKLQKRNDWTYEKYRRLVRGVMASLLKGPTYQSVIDALSLFTNFKVSIAECYKETTQVKYADIINEINPLFSFIIELEKPLEDTSMGQDELMEDTAYVLQLVKPAHTIGILIIILTGSERWDTFYAQRYGIDWHEADEDGLSASFGQDLNEGTFGWRHHSYPGNFTLSNGVVSNSSLTNNGALIGPRYVLADHAIIENDNKNNELFDMSRELQEYIYTFLHSNEYDTYKIPDEQHEEMIANVEARFGFAYNKYLRLTGSKGRTTLNNYLLSAKSSLKDESLLTYHNFNEDRYMFSNLLKVIRFSNNYGISSRFTNNIDVLTSWTEYLKEHSFKKKIISLENNQTIEVERVIENVPTIGLTGKALQEFHQLDKIKDLYIKEVTLIEDAHIPDDPLGSFRLNYAYPHNHGLNNHKLGPNKREKYNLATFFNELYDKSTDYLSVALGFELVEQYARDINDSRIEFGYDHSFNDSYEIYHEPIQFNILKNLQYIPGETKYLGEIVNSNEFADDFSEFLNDPQLNEVLKQVYENDTSNYVENDPYQIQNLLVKLNLIRENPLLADKTEKLDKWIQSIHGVLRTPTSLQLRRTFIRKSVEKYTIGFGLKEEYISGDDFYKSAYTDFSYDNYQFDISEEENHKDIFLYEKVPVLDYPNSGFNDRQFNQGIFSISKTVLSELRVDTFFEEFNNVTDSNKNDIHLLPNDNYDFDISEYEEHNDVFVWENIDDPLEHLTEWHSSFDLNYQIKNELSLLHLYKKEIDKYNFDIFEYETHNDIDFSENASVLDYTGNVPVEFNKNRFNQYRFSNNKAVIYERRYDYIEEDFKLPTDILYSYIINDDYYLYEINESLEFTDNIFSEYYDFYDEDNDFIRLNHKNGRFIGYKSNLIIPTLEWQDNYNRFINDSLTFNNYHSEIFTNPDDLYIIGKTYDDNFTLYDNENEVLRLNHPKSKFIKYRTAIHSFNSIENDLYKLPIYESTNFITNSIDQEIYNKPVEVDESIHYLLDNFTLYDDENNALRLNHPKSKFIKYRTAVYLFNSIENDLYKLPIYESTNFITDSIDQEIYNKPVEVDESIHYLLDNFTLYDDENEVLRLNHPKSKFIKYRTAVYLFNSIENDLYKLPIYDNLQIEIDQSNNNDIFNRPNDLLIPNNIWTDKFTLYDSENGILKLNHTTGKFIKYSTSKIDWSNIYYDEYTNPIYESSLLTSNNIYNDLYKVEEETSYFENDLEEQFLIYDEETEILRLNHLKGSNEVHSLTLIKHIPSFGRFIGKRANIYSSSLDYNDLYKLPIYESTNFITDVIYNEIFNKPNIQFTINNDFTEKYLIYDEDSKLRFNKNRLNNSPLISHLGSIISFYTDYDELYKIPNERSLLLFNKEYIDNYSFNIKDSSNIDNEFNEQYIPYDEDKALTLNKSILNKSFLLSHIGSVIKFYTSNLDTYHNIFEQSSFVAEDPFIDKYLEVDDIDEEPILGLYEYANIQHTNLILNKRKLNQSILSGYKWDKYHPYIFYNDIYLNIITDRLLNDIFLQYQDKYLSKDDDYYLIYDNYNKDIYNVVYNQSFERDLSLLEYNQCFDDLYHQMIFEHVLTQINWYNEEIVNLVNRIQEEKHLEYDTFESENADFKYHKKFLFSSGKFNEPISVDTERLNISIYQTNNDKFIPEDDINHQNIYNFNQDTIEELAETKFNPELISKEKYHNLNSLEDKFKFNLTPVNQGILITNNEIVDPEVINNDKYHPTVTELEYQRVITLTEKVKKPQSVIVIEKSINEEAYIMQPNDPIKFTRQTFNQKKFYRRNVIDTASLKESYNDTVKKVKETQLNIYASTFREKKIKYKDDVSIHDTYFNNDKYIFKMKESNHLDTNVNKTDNYQIKAAVAYMKLEKMLRGQLLTIRRGTYV